MGDKPQHSNTHSLCKHQDPFQAVELDILDLLEDLVLDVPGIVLGLGGKARVQSDVAHDVFQLEGFHPENEDVALVFVEILSREDQLVVFVVHRTDGFEDVSDHRF